MTLSLSENAFHSLALASATALLLNVTHLPAKANPAPGIAAGSRDIFYCGEDGGVPATMVLTPSGNRPFIRWSSTHFAASGWSSAKRCDIVSQRLQSAYSKGSLKFITTGRINDQQVICSALSEGGRCIDLLYTLKPEQDPGQALRALLSARRGESGPISETSERVYFSITNFLK